MSTTPKYDNDVVQYGYLKEVLNTEDKKTEEKIETLSKNYSSQPPTPYYVGSLMLLSGKVYRCKRDRLTGPFSMTDWDLIVNTVDLDNAMRIIYDVNKLEYVDQSDDKIETFYQDDDPSEDWLTDLLKSVHVSDLWTTDNLTQYQYMKLATNPITYDWRQVTVPSSLFDIIDGHKNIFLAQPTNYDKDDLWLDETTKMATSDSESYSADDWVERDDFVESSQIEQEEYHKIYMLPKITEISRYSSSEIKKSIDTLTLTVSDTYSTKVEVEEYVDGIYDDVAATYETQSHAASQIALMSGGIDLVNGRVDDISGFLTECSNNRFLELLNTPNSQGAINSLIIKNFDLHVLYPNMAYPSDYTYPGYLSFYTLIFSNHKITFAPSLPTVGSSYLNQIYNVGGLDGKYYICVISSGNYVWDEISDLTEYNIQEFYINSPIPLQKKTVNNVTTYDTIEFQNNKLKIIQRIGYNSNNHNYEVLGTPITHDFGLFVLPTFETNTYVTMKYFTSVNYECEYIIKNDYTDVYQTKTEALGQVNIQNNNINLKVNKDNIISEINVSPESIKINSGKLDIDAIATFTNNKLSESGSTVINGDNITSGKVKTEYLDSKVVTTDNLSAKKINASQIEGGSLNLTGSNTTIASTNFNVDKNGTAVMNGLTVLNGLMKIGNKEIFNSSGVLSIFTFPCSGGEQDLGWYEESEYNPDTGQTTTVYKKHGLQILYNIPSNFTIVNAYVVLTHIPCENTIEDYVSPTIVEDGYARNVKLYKLNSISTLKYQRYGFYGLPDYSSLPKTAMSWSNGTWASSGYTGNPEHATQVSTGNIKAGLTVGSEDMLLIDTADTTQPSSIANALEKVAMASAILFVIGYYKLT